MVSEGERLSGSDASGSSTGQPAPHCPTGVKRLRFRPAQHLRRQADFERVYARKCRGSDDHLLIFADQNGLDSTRIGLSVSKKNGSAVRRNRIKRLLREAFRLSQHDLPSGLDLILIPRQGTVSTLDDFRQSLLKSTPYLARKLKRQS